MKTLTTLVALLLAGTIYAHANNENLAPKKKVAISNNVEAKYKLIYLNENEGAVSISIINESGEKVHSQTVKNNKGFAQQFDFASLPEGSYTFEVVHPDGSIETEVVHYSKGANTGFRANLLNVDNGQKFRLAVLNNSGLVDIKIFDDKDALIHTATLRHAKGFRRIYNLKKIQSSSFKFEVSNNNDTVTLVTE